MDTLTTLFSHNLWANLQLLDLCAQLSDEQLDSTLVGTYGAIRETFEHIAVAERSYITRIHTGLPYRYPKNAPPMTLAEIGEWLRVSGTDLIESASKVAPDETVSVDQQGIPHAVPKKILLTQTINHATEHRSQIMTILTQLSIQPPDLDAWTLFFDEMN